MKACFFCHQPIEFWQPTSKTGKTHLACGRIVRATGRFPR